MNRFFSYKKFKVYSVTYSTTNGALVSLSANQLEAVSRWSFEPVIRSFVAASSSANANVNFTLIFFSFQTLSTVEPRSDAVATDGWLATSLWWPLLQVRLAMTRRKRHSPL